MPPIVNANTTEKLTAAAAKLSEPVAEASLCLWEVAESKGSNSIEAAVIARALKAVASLLTSESLGAAAASSSDLDLILTLLSGERMLVELKRIDPLAGARIRGLKAKEAIINAEGGCLSAEEAAEAAHVTDAAISKARKEGRLIGLPVGQKAWIYPSWQFVQPGGFQAGLKEVIAALGNIGPWAQTMFMLEKNDRLNGKTPLSVMREGSTATVVVAAKLHGDQGGA